MTVAAELDRIQSRLHDAARIWTRAELLRWFNDGYRELLALSGAVRRFRMLDLPGRHTIAITHEWEDRHARRGTLRKPMRTLRAGFNQGTTLWEAEHLANLTASASLVGWTQEWERAFTGDSDRHYRFSFPRNHQRVAHLAWNERLLSPLVVRELDETDVAWQQRVGQPQWWTTGLGRVPSVEVYELQTTYGQAYALRNPEIGLPRAITGDRTWSAVGLRDQQVYAYTTSGDAEALTFAGMLFAPVWAVCQGWEAAGLVGATWNFTINLTMLDPNLTHVTVHPWELGLTGETHPFVESDAASPGKRAMFPWEWPDGRVPRPDHRIAVTGFGVRATVASADSAGAFGTQPWEADMLDGDTLRTGIVRACYPWEEAQGGAAIVPAVGTIRNVISTARQYLGVATDPISTPLLGLVRDWRSSTDSIQVLEILAPTYQMLEEDTPGLIPAPMLKYLRYYVLARCHGRPGEGRNSVLADHYQRRFLRGVAFFTRLADVAHRDRTYQREMVVPDTRRIARVSFPSEFPAVW